MGNVIVIGIMLVIIALALRSSMKHFKGEGGCCGGSSDTVVKKKLDGKKIGEYIITIEGMHCDNCKVRVENAINRIDGVSAKVILKKAQAVVSYDRSVDKEEIIAAIRRAGYEVSTLRI